jgi:plasmid rolling circle replication initiator protein Rep
MSSGDAVDLLTLPIDHVSVNEGEYLSNVSSRHKPWDVHRGEADDVMDIYANSSALHHRHYAERIANCSQVLGFSHDPLATKKNKLKLTNAWFCRTRFCPVCQWRRSLAWQAKVYQALPKLLKDFPDTRFLFMTLTVKNCEVKDLRATLEGMRKGWVRLTQLRSFPARGWVRSVEITRSQKYRTAHPHYHCLLMVPPAYFKGEYLKHAQWAELWQQSLRADYRPVIDIRVVKLALVPDTQRVNRPPKNMWAAVAEILKYAVKPSDMVRDPDWFLNLSDQVHKTRAVAIGGILRHYIREHEVNDLKQEPGEELTQEEKERLFFHWKQDVRRYKQFLRTACERLA